MFCVHHTRLKITYMCGLQGLHALIKIIENNKLFVMNNLGDRRDYSWKMTIPKAPICNDFDKTTLTDVRLSKKSDFKEENLFFQL